MEATIDIHNWSQYRGTVSMECPASTGTSTTQPSLKVQGNHVRRSKKILRDRTRMPAARQYLLYKTGKLYPGNLNNMVAQTKPAQKQPVNMSTLMRNISQGSTST